MPQDRLKIVQGETLQISLLGLVGLQGAPGPGGGSGTILFSPSFPASAPLSALRVVALVGGSLAYANSSNEADAYRIVGLLTTSVAALATAIAISQGVIFDDSWNWDTSRPIFLGEDGVLTQAAPNSGFQIQVATPISPKQIYFEQQEAILL